jgi:hypothetical protein
MPASAAFVLTLSKDGYTHLAVVRQAHHWGWRTPAAGGIFVLSLSKDRRKRLAHLGD